VKTRDLRTMTGLSAGLGLLVALFASAEFYDATLRAICTINSFFSCNLVDESGKTSTLWIPDYVWGIAGFVAILVVAGIAEQRSNDARWAYGLVALTTAGVGLSLYFLYVELAEIHALCLVCASDYLLGGVAWAGALALGLRAWRRGPDAPPDEPADDGGGATS
jgi:uncharacterized membrane protein